VDLARDPLLLAEELKRDGTSVVGWTAATADAPRRLVRRLVRSRRLDHGLQAGLRAEAEYAARIGCDRCPAAELAELADGELALIYRGEGVVLDRFLAALSASGRGLSAHAAVALLADVIHNAADLQNHPPAGAPIAWGHGEITPRSVLLFPDGFARLYELRLLAAGFRASASPGSAPCRAPELVGGTIGGSPAGDVYAIGMVLALAALGRTTLAASADPLRLLDESAQAAPAAFPPGFLAVIARTLAPAGDRYPTATALRDALREAVAFDFSRWRSTLAGLAALGEVVGSRPDLDVLPAELWSEHPELTWERPRAPVDGDASIESALRAFTHERTPMPRPSAPPSNPPPPQPPVRQQLLTTVADPEGRAKLTRVSLEKRPEPRPPRERPPSLISPSPLVPPEAAPGSPPPEAAPIRLPPPADTPPPLVSPERAAAQSSRWREAAVIAGLLALLLLGSLLLYFSDAPL
jgi:hypothetical protein